ncbi:sulfotransferase family 2 domain-containing protein [Flagellimonas sp. DF-77]|uniref:sulfotransferase family 2 domain-containing protein n=1 Tax=Flagellimonas algarum TaxID=3230298 RepID=UPI00339904DC
MIISHDKKFIFIHNYKVAGTSVRAALLKHNHRNFLAASIGDKFKFLSGKYPKIYSHQFDHHIKAPELKGKIPAEIFDGYYKFGFVRNPWDWQVSLYKFMLKRESHHQHELTKTFKTFDDYIDWRVHEDLHLQKEFFYDGDTNLMDAIGKLEQLDNDFGKICEKIDVNSNLTRKNPSRPKDDGFKKYYTQKSIDLVDQAFQEDIKLFGYQKPSLDQ